ncbi:Alpha-hydroxy-acid oxidizing protein [Sulfidibacter corallicola]|uniref:Alpha-hydroxy-acid oxidizing protein n=1 Tax=Sulfidibacter corallicola TaxID=2818388 RepID=A0A8A4TG72_SULCO|nr:alpha-hydroxy acid oxidase [Sulfidibacter corallicola]QTD48182.1 alpha-hydroxy-acid oxidizing protein [Sulfidibacter corallicola]
MSDVHSSDPSVDLGQLISLFDMEEKAAEILAKPSFDYYASGAMNEITLTQNREAFDRISLHYRVLRDVSQRDLRARVLDREIDMPIMVAPTAFHQLAHPDGELATARAAKRAGTVMILSTLSNFSVEEVAATGASVWFQLYMYKDRGLTRALLDRVVEAGCEAIVFTVDAPVLGKRERDIRNRFECPPHFNMANLLPEDDAASRPTGSGLAAYFADLLDAAISWRDVRWLAEQTKLPVFVKGIVRADDAVAALDMGASGVIISNHGGRQLDTAPATIDVLPRIAQSLAGRSNASGYLPTLLMDGGVRRGTDVVKALAAGADAVLLGRPILWGLACGGEAGVAHALNLLREELDLAMTLCGCRHIGEITPDLFHA